MIDLTDIERLEQHFDERYVKTRDCDDRQESISKRFANDDKRIEMGLRDIAGIKKLLWTIAASGLGTLVAAVLGLIIK